MKDSRKKLLIVDNEQELTEMLKTALEELGGFHVRTENNPSFAVEAARQFLPDLILLDIKMPDLDGADVILRLKNDAQLTGIPVVFLTGNVSESECKSRGGRIGNCRFLPKTMRLDSLVACLNETLTTAADQAATQTRAA
jgi:DNA-binding response OmpR family regulator